MNASDRSYIETIYTLLDQHNMKTFLIILTALLACPPIALSRNDLLGEYEAYTESELVIELTILPKNRAILFTGYYSEYPDVADEFHRFHGSWRKDRDSLTLGFETVGVLEYKIVELLPYSEFGASGGSFGLKPVKMKDTQIKRFGLWKKEALKQFMGK